MSPGESDFLFSCSSNSKTLSIGGVQSGAKRLSSRRIRSLARLRLFIYSRSSTLVQFSASAVIQSRVESHKIQIPCRLSLVPRRCECLLFLLRHESQARPTIVTAQDRADYSIFIGLTHFRLENPERNKQWRIRPQATMYLECMYALSQTEIQGKRELRVNMRTILYATSDSFSGACADRGPLPLPIV